METKGIYPGEVVKFGWKTMKANVGFFIGLLLVFWILGFAPQLIADYVVEEILFLRVILYIIYIVLSGVLAMGMIKICLKFCDNVKGTFGDLFSCFPLFFKYLFSFILYMLIVVGGTILLIFPGVIWAIKFGFFPYFIVEKGLGPVESLKASSRITLGAKWDILGLWFVLVVINVLGILCLGIGIFATGATTMVAIALTYRKLLSQTETAQPQTEETGVTQS